MRVVGVVQSLLQVQLLVEEGGAAVQVQDRWGHTPLQEAATCGAAAVVAYLRQQVDGAASDQAVP